MTIDRTLVGIALVAVALRVLVVFAPGLPAPGLHEDAQIARNFAAGHGYTQDPHFGPTAVKAPAYPALLIPLAAVSGDDATFVRLAGLVNALLGGGTTLLAGLLAATGFGRSAGTLTALALCLHPTHIYLSRVPESSNLSPLLAATALLALHSAVAQSTRTSWALAGFAGGLAILSNPVVVPGLAIATLLGTDRHRRGVLLAALMLVLTLAPWTARNYRLFGKFVAVKSPLWLDLYAGFEPHNLGGKQVLPGDLQQRIDRASMGTPEIEREAIIRRELMPWMLANPRTVVATAAWRVGQYWGLYGQRATRAGRADLLLRRLPEGLLLVVALVGGVAGWRRNRPATLIAVAFLLSYTAAYSAIVAVNVRYHLEIVWAQMMLVGCALDWPRAAIRRAVPASDARHRAA